MNLGGIWLNKVAKSGVPRGIQTPDLQDRNLLLYSAELWAQKNKAQIIVNLTLYFALKNL